MSAADLHRIAGAVLSLRPGWVLFSGGEPLLVRELFALARRFTEAGVQTVLYTSGWTLAAGVPAELPRVFNRVQVSLDGPDAATHDRIRGRARSFDRAMRGLARLDETAAALGPDRTFTFGIDTVVLRSTFGGVDRFCTEIAPRLPHLSRITVGAVIPVGLASRPSFAEAELLTDDQHAELGRPEFQARLQALAPGVTVACDDNKALQLHPELVAQGRASVDLLQIEPDGGVRGMAIYEGVVGNLLDEPAADLWARAVARPAEPYVQGVLGSVRDMAGWAEAARRLDRHFGSDEVRARIDRRSIYQPGSAS
jgi:hypothetical protein